MAVCAPEGKERKKVRKSFGERAVQDFPFFFLLRRWALAPPRWDGSLGRYSSHRARWRTPSTATAPRQTGRGKFSAGRQRGPTCRPLCCIHGRQPSSRSPRPTIKCRLSCEPTRRIKGAENRRGRMHPVAPPECRDEHVSDLLSIPRSSRAADPRFSLRPKDLVFSSRNFVARVHDLDLGQRSHK